MSRIAFARSKGANCVNPNFAWSYVNHIDQFVMFGAWVHLADEFGQLILSEDWKENAKGRKSNGYSPSKRHIELVLEENYNLFTFEQEASFQDDGVPKVKGFTKELIEKQLVKRGQDYYAVGLDRAVKLFSNSADDSRFEEGRAFEVTQTLYERSPGAREKCLEHYGTACVVCKFDFDRVYGDIAKGFIHVHHLVEVSSREGSYHVDPIADLRPVCPNCHAMLHKKRPPFGIDELKDQMLEQHGKRK